MLPPRLGRQRGRHAWPEAGPRLEEVLGIHRERDAQVLEACAEASETVCEEGEPNPSVPQVVLVEGAKVLEDADAFQRRWPEGYLAGEFCVVSVSGGA